MAENVERKQSCSGPSAPTAALPVVESVADYEKIQRIGAGTYGVVYKARERATGKIVALKKVRFDRSKDGMPVTSVRELRVLQTVHHPNIVQLKKVVTGSKADSVFLVFEYCDHDLGRLLDSMAKPFSVSEVKCLVRQLLEAVAYLHDHWIMHRDLKLSNLLYTHTGYLKLCDFGLARYFQPFAATMTPNVVTLWYRAPEVLLGAEEYDEAVAPYRLFVSGPPIYSIYQPLPAKCSITTDMWAVGCILGELLRHEPLFPASSEVECLRMMCNLLGTPNTRIWPGLSQLPAASKFKFPDQPYNYLKKVLPTASNEAINLLNGLLTYDPDKRLTARQALRHPFFSEKPYPKHPSGMPTFPSSHVHHPEAVEHATSAGVSHQPLKRPYQQRLQPQDVKRIYNSDKNTDQRFGDMFWDGSSQKPLQKRVRY